MIKWYHPDSKIGIVDWTHDAFIRHHCSNAKTGPAMFPFVRLSREILYLDPDPLISGGPIDATELIPSGRMYAVKMDFIGPYPIADATIRGKD